MSVWFVGISTVISLAGTAISVKAQQDAADAAEDTAAYNARLQRDAAKQTMEVAADNARRQQAGNDRQMAALRASMAVSGLALEGTPLAVLGDVALQGARDVADIGFQAENQARAQLQGAAMTMVDGANTAAGMRTESIASGLKGVSSATMGYASGTGMIAPKSGGTTVKSGATGTAIN